MIRRMLLFVLVCSLVIVTAGPGPTSVSAYRGGGGGQGQAFWSADGTLLAVLWSSGNYSRLRLYDSTNWKADPRSVWLEENAPAKATSVTFSPDGTTLATGHADAKVRLWDLDTLEQVGEISDLPGGVLMAQYSPDGSLMAIITPDDLLVWDIASNEPIGTLPAPHVKTNVAFSPDSTLLAYGMCDPQDATCDFGGIGLWDIVKREDIGYVSVRSDGEVAHNIHFTPAGDQIAFRDRGESIHLLNVEYATTEPEIRRIIEFGYEMDFNPDGTRLAVVNIGGATIIVWDTEAHTRLWESARVEITQLTESFIHPQFSPDGSMIAAGTSQAAGVFVWDAETGSPLAANLK